MKPRPAWMDAPRQPCARCGRDTWSTATPPVHRACRQRAAPRERSWGERMRRKAAVEAHRRQFGDVCPGWGRRPHLVMPPNRLSADHVHAVARGGREDGPLQVLCAVCNSSKRERSGIVGPPAPRAQPNYSSSRAWMIAYPSPSGTC